MSQAGFYGWIREGVRRAVLLGVSDAVEQLGVPEAGENLSQQLRAVLLEGRGATAVIEQQQAAKPSSARKRLGRSLDDIVQNAKPDEE